MSSPKEKESVCEKEPPQRGHRKWSLEKTHQAGSPAALGKFWKKACVSGQYVLQLKKTKEKMKTVWLLHSFLLAQETKQIIFSGKRINLSVLSCFFLVVYRIYFLRFLTDRVFLLKPRDPNQKHLLGTSLFCWNYHSPTSSSFPPPIPLDLLMNAIRASAERSRALEGPSIKPNGEERTTDHQRKISDMFDRHSRPKEAAITWLDLTCS